MPVPPYTWQTDDWLTANRLQAELRYFKSQPFRPTGVAWHAGRPIYKAIWNAGTEGMAPPSGSGTWYPFTDQTAPGPWTVIADTATSLGARLDLAADGELAGSLPNGGGANGHDGGIALVTSVVSVGSGNSGLIKSGTGYAPLSSPGGYGTFQPLNSSYSSGAYSVDLLDWGLNDYAVTGFYQTTGANPTWNATEIDGSGIVPSLSGFWASSYPAYGTTLSAIPSITTGYTSASAMTSAAMNAQLRNAMYLLNMPPALRVVSVSQSYTANAATVVDYQTVTWDTYGGWNSGSSTYTVPLSGLYLVASFGGFDTFSGATTLRSGLQINGTNYWGPATQTGASEAANASKVQIFSLNAGDTIKGVIQSGLSGSLATTTSAPMMLALWLGAQGTPSPLPTAPDYSYMFAAGTPGSAMPGIMNNYFANDLSFLLQRPHLMAYQSSAQTGMSSTGGVTTVDLQSLTGLIHGDAGDNYSGWTSGTSNLYTAQVPGWYLCVQETFYAAPSLTSVPQYAACLNPTPGGVGAVDYYQKQNAVTVNTTYGGGGVAAVGLYYLRAGDTIQPQSWSNGSSSTTTSTSVSFGNSHFECVWLSE